MKNKIQEGKSLNWLNDTSADVDSGEVVVLKGRIGIAAADISDGKEGTVELNGIYSVAKQSTEEFAVGDELYFDTVDKKLSKLVEDSGNDSLVYAGLCVEAAANPSSTAKVLLQPAPSPVSSQPNFITYAAGSNLVGVDGTGSNAAPLAGTETRLDAIDTALASIIAAMKSARIIKPS